MNNPGPGPRRKRSRVVLLAGLAGGAAIGLTGCGSTHWQRNVYASHADCAADYGAVDCTRLGRPDGSRFLGPVYRMRNGRPSNCHSDDRGAGYRMFYGTQKPETVRVAKGQPGTSCRGSSSSSGSRFIPWSRSTTSARRDGATHGAGGGTATASDTSGVTRGVFGGRSGLSSGG